ncbi:hypothetical protein N7447_006996 [Penicillium robsamsonii]|uniref:uncharacterized protein n=1 Tax=Penicillium robsamsonii TaxID=1792511 RepID=UPI0025477AB1|nr:uncharacterized protein N7447_006996 [Penicillium robsamsonii]KAJ5824656.1 hypothetical protein N7447_006996 [Penicillium robsamsonii]
MNLWLDFTADPENGFEYYQTSLGSPAPTHEMIKSYIRWYASSTQGRLNDDGLPTYDKARKVLLEDIHAWNALLGILTDILKDPTLQSTYYFIDALDECAAGLPSLLDLII